jgi:hypothetical protein
MKNKLTFLGEHERARSPVRAEISAMTDEELQRNVFKHFSQDIPLKTPSFLGKLVGIGKKPILDPRHKLLAQYALQSRLNNLKDATFASKSDVVDPRYAARQDLLVRQSLLPNANARPVHQRIEDRKPVTAEEVRYEKAMLRQLNADHANPSRGADYDKYVEDREHYTKRIAELEHQLARHDKAHTRPLITPSLRLHNMPKGGKSRRSKRSKRSLTKRRKH